MGAFVVAAIIFGGTVLLTLLTLFGSAMSDNTADNSRAFIGVFVTGSIISAGIFASHWFPHIGW